MKTMKTTIQILIICIIALAFATTATAANWSLPIKIKAGTARTNLTVGIAAGAIDGYDPGLDSPIPIRSEILSAYFPHDDWNVVIAGDVFDIFHRDIRGQIPQDFYFEVTSTQSPVTITWSHDKMPEKVTLMLHDHRADTWTDMTKEVKYTFNAVSGTMGFTMRAASADLVPPVSPSGIEITPSEDSAFVTWAQNTESDHAGYKIYVGHQSGQYVQQTDLKNVNNYMLSGLIKGNTYYVALSAYDLLGNESAFSQEYRVSPVIPQYDLTIGKTGSGSVTSDKGTIVWNVNTGTATYDENTQVVLTADAATGYSLSNWTGCDSVNGNQCTVTILSIRNVAVAFAINHYALTVNKSGTGAGTLGGSGTYEYGTSHDITAAASTGSTFTGWSGDCSGSTSPLTVLVDKTITCSAVFILNSYALMVNKSGTGSGTVGGGGTYDYGTSHDITATASEGSAFTGWGGDCTGTISPLSVLVDRAKTCTALFATIGTIQLSSATYAVSEAGQFVTITATRIGGSSGAVGISYATHDGTAVAGSDYTTSSGTFLWSDGDSADKTFTVAINNDALDEVDETFTVSLSIPTGGAVMGSPASATVTITDDDAAPTVQFQSVSSSGSESANTAAIDVILSSASSRIITVNYAAANGTATAGSDYTATSGTLTFNPGEISKTVSVAIISDTVIEPIETFVVTLSAPVNATLGTIATHTYTITNDDNNGVISFSAPTYTVRESGKTVTITARRTGVSTGVVGVTYATSNGTAVAGTTGDYTAKTGTLSWANGDTANKTFAITITNDKLKEDNETFNVILSNPTGGAVLGSPSTAVVTITDDDKLPVVQFSAASSTASESTTSAAIVVTLSPKSGQTVRVNYTTVNGTAIAGSDFTATLGTLTFNPNETSKTITVPIINDRVYETSEKFTVKLSSPVNATLGTKSMHTRTITNDDAK